MNEKEMIERKDSTSKYLEEIAEKLLKERKNENNTRSNKQ